MIQCLEPKLANSPAKRSTEYRPGLKVRPTCGEVPMSVRSSGVTPCSRTTLVFRSKTPRLPHSWERGCNGRERTEKETKQRPGVLLQLGDPTKWFRCRSLEALAFPILPSFEGLQCGAGDSASPPPYFRSLFLGQHWTEWLRVARQPLTCSAMSVGGSSSTWPPGCAASRLKLARRGHQDTERLTRV